MKIQNNATIDKCGKCEHRKLIEGTCFLQWDKKIDKDTIDKDCPLKSVKLFQIGDYDFTDDVTEDIGDLLFKERKNIESIIVVFKSSHGKE